MTKLHFNPRDLARLDERFARVAEVAQERILVQTLNRAIAEVRTEATRGVRRELPALRASTIRDRFRLHRASRTNFVAELEVTRKAIPLIEFAARKTRKGVSVSVKKGRSIIPGVFIARMPSGHRGVFRRIGGRRGPKGQELPIRELFGPSVLEVFQDHAEAVTKFGGERVEAELRRRLELALR